MLPTASSTARPRVPPIPWPPILRWPEQRGHDSETQRKGKALADSAGQATEIADGLYVGGWGPAVN